MGDGWFDRWYAAGYDRFMHRADARGAAAHRQRLVGDAAGRVVEIGAGTGGNLGHYRQAAIVVAVEPDAGMRARAERRAHAAPVPVAVVDADARALPFAADSFDTAVASLVLCTVAGPERAAAELRRVLRPGGTLRFYEHVRAGDPRRRAWQDRLERPWRWFGRGCHPNRDTVAMLDDAGFRIVSLERFDQAGVPPIVRPHVFGTAVNPA